MERILVVDDEIHVVRLLQNYLASKKYDVHTATNGLEAIQKVKDVMPHMVFLDIIMPGMSGIETMQHIKKINPKIVVTMVSGVIDEELAKRTLQLGADDYIVKPIDLKFIGIYLTWKKMPLGEE
jgi:CheY-like chemotaxis protein